MIGSNTTRYERYGELTNDSGHVVAKLNGITDSDLEWSLTGAVEHTEISLGHIGFDWDQTQYDLGFDANRPLGDFQRLSFGLAVRRTELDVTSKVIEPFLLIHQLKNLHYSVALLQILFFHLPIPTPRPSFLRLEFTEIDRFTALYRTR